MVERQQAPAILCHQFYCPQQVFKFLLIDKVIEIEPDPARAHDAVTPVQLCLDGPAEFHIYAQQAVAIRACTGTTTTHLNAKQVVQQGDDKAVMQILSAMPESQGHNRQARRISISHNFQIGTGMKTRYGPLHEIVFPSLDLPDTNLLLQPEHQSCSNRLDNSRCATLLTLLVIIHIAMILRGDIDHRTATHHCGHRVVQYRLFDHQHTRRTGTTNKFMGRDKYRIQGNLVIHIDADIGCGGGIVPECQGIVRFQ